jgi:hypothetical protein
MFQSRNGATRLTQRELLEWQRYYPSGLVDQVAFDYKSGANPAKAAVQQQLASYWLNSANNRD